MSLTVVTGMWGPKRAEYAKTFSASFEKHWPKDTGLAIYTDGAVTVPDQAQVRLLDACEGYTGFMTRHGHDPVARGERPAPGARWKPKCVARGYNFRFDAVKFSGQGFIPHDAAQRLPDGDVLCWLDADVVTHRDVPAGWIESLIGEADGAYLGREPKHSEIGFWAVRLSPNTRHFLSAFVGAYRSGEVFAQSEWHSAFIWDAARLLVALQGYGLNMRNLTPGGSGHVFAASPLRTHLEHRKGARKGFR